MQAKKWRSTLGSNCRALILTLGVFGCSAGEEAKNDKGDEGDDVAVLASALLPSTCATATPLRSLTGGGSFTRSGPYTTTGCTNAYVVDIVDQSTSYDYGTWVAYDDAIPTTAATCSAARITAAIWRTDAARTFIGEVTDTGHWFVDPATNVGACRLPRVVLERNFPSYQPNNDRNYRVAIRAERTGGAISRFAFASVQRPADSFYGGLTVTSEIRALPAGAIHPKVHAMWLTKGTARATQLCRNSQLEVTLAAFGAPSLLKLGASSANLAARDNAYVAMRNAYCLTGSTRTEAAFQTAAVDFFNASQNVLGDVLHEVSAVALGYGDHLKYASALMDEALRHDIGLLIENCQTSPMALWGYVSQGALPTGVAADRLMFGTCSGSTPQQLSVRLGAGGTRTIEQTRATLADCVAPAGDDVCNDPRAADAAPQTGDPGTLAPEDACLTENANGDLVNCTDDNDRVIRDEAPYDKDVERVGQAFAHAAEEQYKLDHPNANRAEVDAKTRIDIDPQDEAFLRRLAKSLLDGIDKVPVVGPPLKVTIEEVIDRIPMEVVEEIASEAGRIQLCSMTTDRNLDICEDMFPDNTPTEGGGDGAQYCGTDFVSGGWYAAGGPRFTNGRKQRQISESDRLQHCFCKATEPLYAGGGGALPGIELSSTCPSPAEKLAHECLSTPQGPDDGTMPSLKCLTVLQPAQTDLNVWGARICDRKLCPSGRTGVYNTSTDACECRLEPPIVGGGLGCPVGNAALCLPDNAAPCLCEPIDFGNVPFGNDPQCRLDPTTWPGSLDAWTAPDPGLLAHHTIGSTRYLAFETGPKSQIAAVSPMLYRSMLPAIGPVMRQPAFISAVRSASTNIDVQLYCTNPSNNLFHGFMGQCRLNSLTPGTPGNCDITLTSSLRSSCFNGGGFTLEWDVQAPTTYKAFVGLGAFSFTGALESTPASQLAPVCPRPAPETFMPTTRPLWEALGGTGTNPIIVYELGIGGTVPVGPTMSLPRVSIIE